MIEQSFSIYHLEFYLMIVARIGGTFALAPIFGDKSVPRRIRIGLVLCVALVVTTTMEYTPLNYTTLFGFTILLIKELVVGLLIGFLSNMCVSIIGMAGMLIDREIGFTMVTTFDANSNSQTTITANFYNYLVLLIMLCSNMHYFILSAIIDSFKVIPIGNVVYSGKTMYSIMIGFITNYFVIAFRIALPVFVAITLLNVILGTLAKTAPQMNMFSIGMQLKVLVGLIALIATIMFLPNITDNIYTAMKDIVTSAIKGMY